MKESARQKHLNRLNQSEIRDFFIKTVEGFGGSTESGVWYYVSRILFQEYGIEVDKPEQLRYKYELFTCPPVKFESEQMRILIESFFDSNFNTQHTFVLYKERMEFFTLNHRQFKINTKIKTALTRCMEIMFTTFCLKKREHIYDFKQIKISSTIFLLKTTLHDDKDLGEDSKQIKKSGVLLEKIIKAIIPNFDLKRPYMYELLSPICNRKSVQLIFQTIMYFHELRQIYYLRYLEDDQLTKHPFLKKTIFDNKQHCVYLQFITDDWIKKLNMFTNCQQDQEIEDRIVIKLNKANQQLYEEQTQGKIQPLQNKLKKVKQKSTQIFQTKRSIRLPEDIIRRHSMTVNFNQSIEEDHEDSDSLEEEFQKYFENQTQRFEEIKDEKKKVPENKINTKKKQKYLKTIEAQNNFIEEQNINQEAIFTQQIVQQIDHELKKKNTQKQTQKQQREIYQKDKYARSIENKQKQTHNSPINNCPNCLILKQQLSKLEKTVQNKIRGESQGCSYQLSEIDFLFI